MHRPAAGEGREQDARGERPKGSQRQPKQQPADTPLPEEAHCKHPTNEGAEEQIKERDAEQRVAEEDKGQRCGQGELPGGVDLAKTGRIPTTSDADPAI